MSKPSEKQKAEAQSIDPHKLPGLMMPAYLLKCLTAGMTEYEIGSKFPEDAELVKLWLSYLYHSHWATKVPLDGSFRWEITHKGKERISRFNFE
jgi:hypothetical protein